jgi:hypothetical protein
MRVLITLLFTSKNHPSKFNFFSSGVQNGEEKKSANLIMAPAPARGKKQTEKVYNKFITTYEIN